MCVDPSWQKDFGAGELYKRVAEVRQRSGVFIFDELRQIHVSPYLALLTEPIEYLMFVQCQKDRSTAFNGKWILVTNVMLQFML